MQIERLKKVINDFEQGIIPNDNPSYVPILIIESVLKKKNQEFTSKAQEFASWLSTKLKIKIDSIDAGSLTTIWGHERKYTFGNFGEVFDHWLKFYANTGTIEWHMNDYYVRPEFTKELKKEAKVQEFMAYVKQFTADYEIDKLGIPTNMGLFIDVNYDASRSLYFVVSDDNNSTSFKEFYDAFFIRKNKLSGNFYYIKNCLKNERSIHFNNDAIKTFMNEETLGKIYASIKIDISIFSEKLQRDIRDAQIALKAELKAEQEKEVAQTQELQLKRIMKAYALIKEATELLSLAKSDLNLERIRLDNINSILFKNNGFPNSQGYIEFEDFFKNNMVLRMLDLSNVDLTNVNITGMDFSGTNIHIDPQVIYHKDMSYVNATDVKFFPFSDSFDGVILDGTIINDYEANIDLAKVRSYNQDTHIVQEVVSIIL